jgi:hypothetical protein
MAAMGRYAEAESLLVASHSITASDPYQQLEARRAAGALAALRERRSP